MFSFFSKLFSKSALDKYKQLITLLLNNDIKVNRNFLSEIIQKFEIIDYENLFYGNEDYPYPIEEQENFKKLIKKFHNYFYIIDEWKDQKEKYKYIKILWMNYPLLKEINQNTKLQETENKIKEIFKGYSLPSDIKKKIIEIITNSPFKEVDKIIEDLPPSVDKIISDLNDLKEKFNKPKEKEPTNTTNDEGRELNIYFGINLIRGFANLAGDLYDCYKQTHNIDYNDKKADKMKKILTDKLSNKKSNNNKVKFNFNRVKNVVNDFKNGQIYEGLKGSFTLLISIDNCFRDIINLYNSISILEKEEKEFNKYKIDYSKIIKDFKDQTEKFKKISKNRDEALKEYYNISQEIGRIYKDLIILISSIKNKIKINNSRKTESVFGIIFSSLRLFAGIGAIVITRDITFGFDITSSGLNLVGDAVKLKDALEYLEKYEKMLKECEKQREEIQSFIDELLEQLKIIKNGNKLNSFMIKKVIRSF